MRDWNAYQYALHGLRMLKLSAITFIGSVLMLAIGAWGPAIGAGLVTVLMLATGSYWVHQSAVLSQEAIRDA